MCELIRYILFDFFLDRVLLAGQKFALWSKLTLKMSPEDMTIRHFQLVTDAIGPSLL